MNRRFVEARPGYRSLERLLTTAEVAELLGAHRNTVIRLGDRGELPFIRIVGRGDRRYRVSDVEAFIARGASR